MRQTGRWRATYTPGDWVVLSGPTSLVVLQPAPGKASTLVNAMWDDVVASSSIDDLVQRLAAFNIEKMPSFAAFFWDGAGLRSLVRGSVRVMDLTTGDFVADGTGVQTWSEVGLGDLRQVRIDMAPAADDLLQLPLVVGAVTASAIVLDATDEALVSTPQQPADASSTGAPVEPSGSEDVDEEGEAVRVADAAALATAAPRGEAAGPTEQPGASAQQPDTPAEQPDTPAEQPDTPAEQPDTPAEQPDAPADQTDAAPAEESVAPQPEPEQPESQPEQGSQGPPPQQGQQPRPADAPPQYAGPAQQGSPQQGSPQQGPPQQGAPGPYGQQGPPQQYGSPPQGRPGAFPPQDPYGRPPAGPPQYGQPPAGPPQYGQPQYGQPQYGQPQYGQPGRPPGPPPGYAPGAAPGPYAPPAYAQQQAPIDRSPFSAPQQPQSQASPPPDAPRRGDQGQEPSGPIPSPTAPPPSPPQPQAGPPPSGPVVRPEDEADHDGATVFATSLARAHKVSDAGGGGGEGLVLADMCVVQHPNPPGSQRCRICGGSIPTQSPRLVTRPVLAVLHPSQGAEVEVDRPVLIGRSPTADRVAQDSLPRLMTVPSPSHDISRTHVRVTPQGWDLTVMDEYSTNGTILVRPGAEPERERLTPGEAVPVQAGQILDLGDGITITIEPPS